MSIAGKRTRKKSKADRKASRYETRKYLLNADSPFMVKEAYNLLRTNVIFSLPGNQCKFIGITSCTSKEGKSLTLLNLAISLGQINKRVLLIDCDMRQPTVASILNISSTPGLSDLLVEEFEPKEVIQHLYEWNMDVLVAGTIPPDATRLLESEQMSQLISVLNDSYDYVLFDLPPVSTIADTSIISKYLDGFILVVRHKKTEYRELTLTINCIQATGTKLLGYVYNDMSIIENSSYKNYYGDYR